MPDLFVEIPGQPHSAQVIFDPAEVGTAPGSRIHANGRVTPDFNAGAGDILDGYTCEIDHHATVVGVTALRLAAEYGNEPYASQHARIVDSMRGLVATLNDIANGTGEWGPPSL